MGASNFGGAAKDQLRVCPSDRRTAPVIGDPGYAGVIGVVQETQLLMVRGLTAVTGCGGIAAVVQEVSRLTAITFVPVPMLSSSISDCLLWYSRMSYVYIMKLIYNISVIMV